MRQLGQSCMAHKPGWHILDAWFSGSDDGLVLPARKTSENGARLQIHNLDRSDPPYYRPDGVPRSDYFNANVFQLTPDPCMPSIPVDCSVAGFDPNVSPIYWRLVCRHILCRYCNTGDYRYQSTCETFDREWQGQSSGVSFTLFGASSSGSVFTYNDESRVLGGHALLEVAAQVNDTILADYVHLRIAGANPTVDGVCSYLQTQLSGTDRNILYMLQAVFRQESNATQFNPVAEDSALMIFTQPYHNYNPFQPDCPLPFIWPGDPSNFPLASFDFGVGISQFTEVGGQRVTADIAWDWRENVRQAVNLFLEKLQDQFTPGMTWLAWAMKTWAAYNGSGPRAAEYAQEVSQTPEGSLISTESVANLPAITLLPPPPPLPEPGEWLIP